MPIDLTYYNKNAQAYFDSTVNLDLSEHYPRFLARVPVGGLILDAGCGSGRDSKAFLALGYRVSAFDGSAELASLAAAHFGQSVGVRTFSEVTEVAYYDGVWACASLLHVPANQIVATLGNLWAALKPGGAIYVSFRVDSTLESAGERQFTDADEEKLREWLGCLPEPPDLECWISDSVQPGRPVKWLNAVAVRRPTPVKKLIPGDSYPFLPHLCDAIAKATEIDLAVAFIKTSGLRLLLPDLHAARRERAARVRVLTSDYLDVTDPDALALLMLLQEDGAQVRMYESRGGSFHLKAYLFAHLDDGGRLIGTAFIGSSNISRQALQNGLEWNYKISYPGDSGYLEARNRFEELYRNERTVGLTDEWIRKYRKRRVLPILPVEPGSHEREEPAIPSTVQRKALAALEETRREGYRRGLVVMATGLGKTWLAVFDVTQFGARRVLFVAHREEILQQAAETFLRIRPNATVGFYKGSVRDKDVEVLCASVQTLGRALHLDRFAADHFDYVVVDEFHHASATTYRRLLQHFRPAFLLGLTATPDRTDQSDILSLCDDNLVFRTDLVEGVNEKLLCPFSYFGIFDDEVDYREIPWRNGQFDPEQLSNKLATLGRAQHALREWRSYGQQRTLAFCVSIRHAEFMAQQFAQAGVNAAAVHGSSAMSRGEALELLRAGTLRVVFSVDLFSEGVDLPLIDTVLMLRPTESKILFLQQLGRGLRQAEGKERLVILDFIGNHRGFLHKPQALFGVEVNHRALADFARLYERNQLDLPDGCFVNYDLRVIEFFKSLDGDGAEKTYEALRDGLGRRPTLVEFHRGDGNVKAVRDRFGSWFGLVASQGDLDLPLSPEVATFLREVEVTEMTRCFKMILLEAFQELDGWNIAPTVEELAAASWEVLQRRPGMLKDVTGVFSDGGAREWVQYWRSNPVNAWVGGNKKGERALFRLIGGKFVPTFAAFGDQFSGLVQEVVDYRLAAYESRRANVLPFVPAVPQGLRIPYFPNLKIACGHFRTGTADEEEFRHLGEEYGKLDSTRHFIARATGNSMDGGKNPIRDGDYLLLEHRGSERAGSITGSVMVIERQDETGENQYLLRTVVKRGANDYILRANNPAYPDMQATDEHRTLARLRNIISPLEMMRGREVFREEIPGLFGEEFNPGRWNVGHVVLNSQKAHVLLVTISKRGKHADHKYLDYWVDVTTFHWSSQRQTTPRDKRGQELVQHREKGITIHLFVREDKLVGGKGAPFRYYGPVEYSTHSGEAPMAITLKLMAH